MAKDLKRSLTIAGHRTSLSLEPEFWSALRHQATQRGTSIAALAAEIDAGRGARNLSSAIRVWLLREASRTAEPIATETPEVRAESRVASPPADR
jgi:predicted DNA-binding ribbon-helix-helix protein